MHMKSSYDKKVIPDYGTEIIGLLKMILVRDPRLAYLLSILIRFMKGKGINIEESVEI